MLDKTGLYMIQEMVSPKENKLELLSESKGSDGKRGGVKFKAILQEAEVENSNRRIYKKNALEEGCNGISDRINKGIFFCEMDHPNTSDPKRFMTVLLKETSHRVLDLKWKGNLLEATCQTTSNSIGKDLRGLIEEDGIALGFSLRAVGKTKPSTARRDLTEVVGNMKLVSWDAVSNPSHTNALTQQLLESSDLMNMLKSESEQVSMLSEAMGMDLELFSEDASNRMDYDHVRNMVILSTKDMNIRGYLEEHIKHEFRASFRSLIEG